MRKQLLVLVAVVALTLAGSSAAYAQQPVTRITVPFQFIVGDTLLPAGAYLVTNVRDPGMLSVRSEDGKSVATALANMSDMPAPGTNAALSFRKIGGQCFLAAVTTPDARTQVIPLTKDHVDAVLARLNGTQPTRPSRPTVR
jgi:hypothetical protein